MQGGGHQLFNIVGESYRMECQSAFDMIGRSSVAGNVRCGRTRMSVELPSWNVAQFHLICRATPYRIQTNLGVNGQWINARAM